MSQYFRALASQGSLADSCRLSHFLSTTYPGSLVLAETTQDLNSSLYISDTVKPLSEASGIDEMQSRSGRTSDPRDLLFAVEAASDPRDLLSAVEETVAVFCAIGERS